MPPALQSGSESKDEDVMLSDLPAMPRGLREVHHQRPVPPQDDVVVLSDLPAMPRGLREVHPHPHTQEGTADRKSGKGS